MKIKNIILVSVVIGLGVGGFIYENMGNKSDTKYDAASLNENPSSDEFSFESYSRINNLKGFRKYELGSDISNYPELLRLPENDLWFGDTAVKTHCYYNPKEDLKFGDLKAERIQYHTYQNKLFTIIVTIDDFSRDEFSNSLNNLYNPYYLERWVSIDGSSKLVRIPKTNFENDSLEIVLEEGILNDCLFSNLTHREGVIIKPEGLHHRYHNIIYVSKLMREQIAEKVSNDRERKF